MIDFVLDHMEEFLLVMGAVFTYMLVLAAAGSIWDYIKEKWNEVN